MASEDPGPVETNGGVPEGNFEAADLEKMSEESAISREQKKKSTTLKSLPTQEEGLLSALPGDVDINLGPDLSDPGDAPSLDEIIPSALENDNCDAWSMEQGLGSQSTDIQTNFEESNDSKQNGEVEKIKDSTEVTSDTGLAIEIKQELPDPDGHSFEQQASPSENAMFIKQEPLSPPVLEEQYGGEDESIPVSEFVGPAPNGVKIEVTWSESYIDEGSSKKNSKKKAKNSLLKPLFGTNMILCVRLDRLTIPKDCMLPNGRVDLKVLRKSRPVFFRKVKRPKVGYLGRRKSKTRQEERKPAKDGKTAGPTKRKSTSDLKSKRKKLEPNVIRESPSSGSDSDLEELRRKLSVKRVEIPKPGRTSGLVLGPQESSKSQTERVEVIKRKAVSNTQSRNSSFSKNYKDESSVKRQRTDSTCSQDETKSPSNDDQIPVERKTKAKSLKQSLLVDFNSDEDVQSTNSKISEVSTETSIKKDLDHKKHTKAIDKNSGVQAPSNDSTNSEKSSAIGTNGVSNGKDEVKELVGQSNEDHSIKKDHSEKSEKNSSSLIRCRIFQQTRELRRFYNTLMIEIGPMHNVFSKRKHAKFSLSELEKLVKQAVNNMDNPAKSKASFVSSYPKPPNDIPSEYRSQVKQCSVSLEDLMKNSSYAKTVEQALHHYKSGTKRRNRKRRDILLSGLKLVKDSDMEKSKDQNTLGQKIQSKPGQEHPGSEKDLEEKKQSKKIEHKFVKLQGSDDLTKVSTFRIPKKDPKKVNMDKSKKEDLLATKKSQIHTDRYNLNYGQRKGQQMKGSQWGQNFPPKKNFQSNTSETFDLRSLVKEEIPKKEELKDAKAREKLKKDYGDKTNEERVSITEEQEVRDLLSLKVKNFRGRIFTAFIIRREGNLTYYKCFSCDTEVEGKKRLLQHASSFLHEENMRKFTVIRKNDRYSSPRPSSARSPGPDSRFPKAQEKSSTVIAPWAKGSSKTCEISPWLNKNMIRRERVRMDPEVLKEMSSPSAERRSLSPLGDDHLRDDDVIFHGYDSKRSSMSRSNEGSPRMDIASYPRPIPALPKPIPASGGLSWEDQVSKPVIDRKESLEDVPYVSGIPRVGPGYASFQAVSDRNSQKSISPMRGNESTWESSNLRLGPVPPVPAVPESTTFLPLPSAPSTESLINNPPASSSEVPQPVPKPVPPPDIKAKSVDSSKLSFSSLEKLPTPMDFNDRVNSLREPEQQERGDKEKEMDFNNRVNNLRQPEQKEKGDKEKEEEEVVEKSATETDENEGETTITDVYDPGSESPLWEIKKPSKNSRKFSKGGTAAKEKSDVGDFEIDTTTSFLNASKSELVEDIREKSTSSKRNKEKEEDAASNFTNILDKIIQSLKKPKKAVPAESQGTNQAPPLPENPPPPPLPPSEPPPPPPEDEGSDGGVSPPSSSILEMSDNAMVCKIVSEIDHDLSDQEKLRRAKEKLGKLLHDRSDMQRQMNIPTQIPPPNLVNMPPQRIFNPPPQTLINPLFSQPPPPMSQHLEPVNPLYQNQPNRNDFRENEITSFISQWCPDASKNVTLEDANPTSNSKEDPFSSALAKIRARRRGAARKGASKVDNLNPEPMELEDDREDKSSDRSQIPSENPMAKLRRLRAAARERMEAQEAKSVKNKLITNESKGSTVQESSEFSSSSKVTNSCKDVENASASYGSIMEWSSILDKGWSNHLMDFQREREDKSKAVEKDLDLGTRFQDPSLNQRVKNKSGEVINVFESCKDSDNLPLRCNICDLRVTSKKTLDIHRLGKKHSAAMENFQDFDLLQPKPPGEDLEIPEEPAIQKMLDLFQDAPLIGVEFIIEILKVNDSPRYYCFLCKRDLDAKGLISDLISGEHRLEYLKRYFPIASKKFAKVPNMSVWERPTFDFLEGVSRKIESKYGRLKPSIAASEEKFENEKYDYLEQIKNGRHFSESSDLDFSTLPDPFGSYLRNIDPSEISPVESEESNMLLPVKDSRKEDEGLDHIEDPEMQSLLQREIERFRKTQTEKKSGENEASGKDNQDSVKKKLSALRASLKKDELEEVEKYRSRYRKNDDDDNDDDIQEIQEITGPVFSRFHNRSILRRGNRGKNPQSYKNETSSTSRHVRSRSRDRRRSPGGRRASRDRSPARRRSSHDRSSGRRRSRDRDSRSRRSRSRSPFSTLRDKWKRFKHAEQVMLSSVNRRKDIYDKRPEDHPSYAEEWKFFWEKRYNEIQMQGKDADNHDYKTEWIPYWAKRVEELFNEEIEEKIKDLLNRYQLESASEPSREEFERKEAEKKLSNIKPNEEDEIGAFLKDYEDFRNQKGDEKMPHDQRSSRSRSRSRSRSKSRSRRRSRSPRDHRSRSPLLVAGRSRSPRGSRSRNRGQSRSLSPHSENKGSFSGITDLEDRRDRGIHRSPPEVKSRHGKSSARSGMSEFDDGPVMIMPLLRLLTALEDILGSLGPEVNSIMGRALNLEQNRAGASNILLEDAEVACIMDLVKEKLAGQMVAGLLEETKQGTVRVVLDHLNRVLKYSTKKRPEKLPTLTKAPSGKEKLKKIVAEQLSKILMSRGMSSISDYDLHVLVFKIIDGTELDDGTIEPPPPKPPTPPPQQGLMVKDYGGAKGDVANGASFGWGSTSPDVSHYATNSDKNNLKGQLSTTASYSTMSTYPGQKTLQTDLGYSSQSTTGSYSTGQVSSKNASEITSENIANDDAEDNNEAMDEFDELTDSELRSLLDNFTNLTESEQMDLIKYMKRLEKTNPDRVRLLKTKKIASNPGSLIGGQDDDVRSTLSQPHEEVYQTPLPNQRQNPPLPANPGVSMTRNVPFNQQPDEEAVDANYQQFPHQPTLQQHQTMYSYNQSDVSASHPHPQQMHGQTGYQYRQRPSMHRPPPPAPRELQNQFADQFQNLSGPSRPPRPPAPYPFTPQTNQPNQGTSFVNPLFQEVRQQAYQSSPQPQQQAFQHQRQSPFHQNQQRPWGQPKFNQQSRGRGSRMQQQRWRF